MLMVFWREGGGVKRWSRCRIFEPTTLAETHQVVVSGHVHGVADGLVVAKELLELAWKSGKGGGGGEERKELKRDWRRG
jgi:hypothetical protein